MARVLHNVKESTQSLGGQMIDRARELPAEVPRQLTKTINYALGRGFIALSLFGLSMAGAGTGIAMWVALPLLTGFQAFMDYRKEQNAKHHLLNEFREEVAIAIGKDAKDVDLKDLQTVAEGDKSRGIEANPILDEEWDRIGRRRTVQFVTTAISAVATLMLINFPMFTNAAGASQTLVAEAGDWVAWGKDQAISMLNLPEGSTLASIISNGFTYTGLTVAASWVLQAANAALDFVSFGVLGLSSKTTHDRIDDISKALDNGKLITKEQVLGVFVSANKDLAEDIRKEFGKDYDKLGWQKQQAAVAKFGGEYKVYELAYMINFRMIKPQELAFAAVGRESGVKPRDQYGNALQAHEQDVAKEQEKAAEKEAKKAESKSFVERFTRGKPREEASFLDRLSQQELHAAEAVHSRS